MKRLALPLIVAALTLLVMYNLYSGGQETQRELATLESRSNVERFYQERAPLVLAQPDPVAYQAGMKAFLPAYFAQIDAHRKAFGGPEIDAYLKELEARNEDEASYQAKRAAFEDVKAIYTQMREGTYAPIWTGVDKGLRMDLLPGKVTHLSGEPTMVIPVVLWGAQREVRDSKDGKVMMVSANFSIGFKLYDGRDKLFGEMNGGDPANRLDHPERYIADFPPQAILGKFQIPLFPAEVERADISFDVSTSTSYGGPAVNAHFEWNRDELPSEWKLRPGEAWDGAQISERSAEEIGGR